MPADPVAAGRKGGKIGGKSRSAKKLAAIRKNGFQKVYNTEPAPPAPPVVQEPTPEHRCATQGCVAPFLFGSGK